MLIVVSPSKSLDFDSKSPYEINSQPALIQESERLMKVMKKKSPKKLMDLMSISESLGQLNYERNQVWETPFTQQNAKQAVFAFTGDVYAGLDALTLEESQIDFTQNTLRILSGLHGILKPLDLIQPYRLEMGTSLKTTRGTNLYKFWGDRVTNKLNEDLEKTNSKVLLNLASNEYYKVLNPKKVNAEIITPSFLDFHNGDFKMISFFAKKARGLMSRYVIDQQINSVNNLMGFNYQGYQYNAALSKELNPVFTRKN